MWIKGAKSPQPAISVDVRCTDCETTPARCADCQDTIDQAIAATLAAGVGPEHIHVRQGEDRR